MSEDQQTGGMDDREADANPDQIRQYYEQRMLDMALRGASAPDLGADIVAAAQRRRNPQSVPDLDEESRTVPAADADTPAHRSAAPSGSWLTFKRTWYLAAGLAGLVVLPAAANWAYRAWQRQDLLDSKVHLLVSAPTAVPDGAALRFHVETHDLARQKMIAVVDWKVLDAKGQTLRQATALCDGTTDITVGGRLDQPRKLVVTARVPRTGFTRTIEQAIHPGKAAPLVHLTSDKPAYRPGEAVLLRIACLDRLTLRGADHLGLRCRIVDPRNSPVKDKVLGVGKGVAAWNWQVPLSAAGGRYALEVRDQNDTFTLERHQFLVRNFQPPRLGKKITLDRQTYAAGESGDAELSVVRATGGPAVGAKVHATLIVDGERAWQDDAVLDGGGRAVFRFAVPGNVQRGAARFVTRVTDGGTVETELKPFVIPTDRVDVALYPEGGELIAGAENRVYAQVRDGLGRPLSGAGQLVDDHGVVIAPFATVHMGRARFAFTPITGRSYRLRLTTPLAKTVDLPKVQDEGVVLQPVGEFYAAGAPARCRVFTAGRGPWIAAVFCRGVLVGQQSIQSRGRNEVAVPLADEASGVLRVTVFDHKLRPVAERLVQRDARRNLTVSITPETARAAPGSTQKLTLRTTDETGAPVSCVVGLTVTDRAVADMLDFTRIGLDDQRQLFTDVEKPDDRVEEFLARTEDYRRNVDLLLGSMGWRRYVWRGDVDEQALVAAGGDWARALPMREGRSRAPMVSDNLGEYQTEIATAQRSWFKAKSTTYGLGVLSLIVFGLLGMLQAFTRVARRREWGPPLLVGSLLTVAFLCVVVVSFGLVAELAPGRDSRFGGNPAFDMFASSPSLIDSLASLAMGEPGDELDRPQGGQGGFPAGFFYDDGGDGDVRGRTEYDFADRLGDQTWSDVRDFDVQIAQGATVEPSGVIRFLPLPRFEDSFTRGFGFTHFDQPTFRDLDDDGLPGTGLPYFRWRNLFPPSDASRRIFDEVGRPRTVDSLVEDFEQVAKAWVELRTPDLRAQARIAQLEQTIREKSVLLEIVNRRYPGIFSGLHPLVTGTVAHVSANGKLLTIELKSGAEHLVAGDALAIFNAAEGYKADAVVYQIEAGRNYCFARVSLDQGKQLSIGDTASTDVSRSGVSRSDVARSGSSAAITPAKRRQLENLFGNPELSEVLFRYAHKASDSRRSFAQTLFWQPYLVTDDKGEATVEFDVSDSITTWKIYADAHGDGRVGQAEASFESYLPFYLQTKVPARVSEGDVLRLPISLVADDPDQQQAQIEIQTEGPLALRNPGSHAVTLRGGRGRVLAELVIGEPEGAGDVGKLSIRGQVGAARDVAGQRFLVVPRGFPRRVDHGGKLQGAREVILALPDELARRTASLELRCYPSPLASLEGALAGMLQEPHGCFEQVSSANYPNVMVLGLLDASGDNVPAAALEARRLLARGYPQLVGYEVPGGGFDWWGKSPAHEALTAYGLLQFTDMAKVFAVDPKLVARTRTWLLGRRDGEGGFISGAGAYGHFMGGTKASRSAYITYALLRAGATVAELSAEVAALERRAAVTLDAYELAITACALAVAGRPGAGAARARLLAMQRGDGSLLGVGSITGSGPTDLRIETTSFAVLAWSATADKGRGNPDAAVPSAAPSAVSSAVSSAAQRAVRFLETQRQGNGTFGGTQATVMALQALTAYLGANTPTIEPGTLKVFLGDQELYALQLQGTEKRAIAIDHLGRHLAVGDNKVRLELSGGNAFPFSMALTYRADQPDSSPDCALDLNTWLSEKVLPEGGTTALHAVVRNKGKQPVANPMVLVGLPAGLHCDTKVLDDLKKSEAIAAWELIDNDIALYLRGLQAGETRDIVVDLVGLIPGVSKGAASRAYLYYAARHKTWAPPIQVEVTVGR